MKDLSELLRLLVESSNAANNTYESCTEHARKMLSTSDYKMYESLMCKLTDLMSEMATHGKMNIWVEVLASLNRITEDGINLKATLNANDKDN